MRTMLPVVIAALALFAGNTGRTQVPMTPDTPFKLATFATDGPDRIGMQIDGRLVDLHQANAYMVSHATSVMTLWPGDLVEIEVEGIGTLETPIQ